MASWFSRGPMTLPFSISRVLSGFFLCGLASFWGGLAWAAPPAGGPVVLALAAGDSITVACPNTLNLGTYDTGATTSTFTVTCVPDHNVTPRGNMTVTASPASNSMNVTNGAFTYTINFSTFTTSSGTLTGTFATGITLLNTKKNGFNFRYNVRAQSPVPTNAASGTYTGTQTLTFALF
jgi:hypothetical protein